MAMKKATSRGKAGNRLVDKIATAKHKAKIAQGQVSSNMERGSKVNIRDNYAAASTAAQRTKDLNKLNSASKTAGRAKNMESKLKKAAATKSTARKPKAGTSTVSKVVKRAKTVAREVRDIPTSVGSIIASREVPQGGAMKYAKKDLKTQIKEVGSAIKSGKKGTVAAQGRYGSVPKGYKGGGGLDWNVSKPKGKRK